MKALGQYDSETRMFIEEPRELDRAHLEFVLYLMKTGRLVSPRKVDAEFAQAERA